MTQSRTRTAGRLALASVLTAGLLLAACGDDTDDEATAGDDTETSNTAADESTTTAGGVIDDGSPVEDGVLTVELADYEFKGLPESVPAGTRIEVENTSGVEFHELVAFKVPEGEERTAEELVQLSEEELGAVFAGPPTAVLLAGPDGGEQTAAVGDGTLAEPGRYVLFCSIPVGADPDELAEAAQNPEAGPPPAAEDAGPPHFTQGMYADLVVE